MRIARLDLLAFGPFTDLCLELDQGDYGLHLIYGPNEAGKSSALRALRQFFYGIETRTTDQFVHSYDSLRIGAVLRDEQGGQWHFIRRKGNKGTLRSADEREVIEPAVLSDLLGGVEEQDFRHRFGIDRQELVRGGQEIVRGEGNLGGILFAAGSGLPGLNSIQARLEQDAEELFKPQGSVPRINRALREFQDARRKRKDSMLRPATWSQHQQALQAASARHDEIATRLVSRRGELQRLERIRQAVPLIDKRRYLLQQLQDLAGVPLLPEDFTAQRYEAMGELSQARSDCQQAAQTLANIQTALAGLDISEPLLEHAAAIQALSDPLGAIRKAACDRPALVAEREHLRQEVRRMLEDLQRDVPPDEVHRLELDLSRRQRIKRLAGQQAELLHRCQAAQQRYETLQRSQAEKEDQLQRLPPAADPAQLRRLLRRTAGDGDLEQHRSQLADQLRGAERQAELCLARLGLWSGSLDDAERLAVPAQETIDRLERQLQKDQKQVETWDQRRQELQSDIARRSGEIEELRQQGDALTEADLLAVRQHRDAGWRLVLGAWQGPEPAEPAVAEFVAGCSPAEDLAAAYQVAVERADGAADRMRREADQVARKAHLLCELQASRALHQEAVQAYAAAVEQLEATQQQWRAQWTPLDIDPLPPREMLAWTSRHCDLVRLLGQIRADRDQVAGLDERIESRRGELLQLLDLPGDDSRRPEALAERSEAADAGNSRRAEAGHPSPTLAELRDLADEVAGQRERLRAQREQLEKDLQTLARQLPETQQELQRAEQELAGWQEQWAAAMSWLELQADVSPEEAWAFTEAVHDLLTKSRDADQLSRRIDAIDQDAERFACRVRALAAEVLGEPAEGAAVRQTERPEEVADQPAELLADDLLRRLNACQTQQARREELLDQQRRELLRQREATAKIELMNQRLAALCREAGCASPDELPELERRSAQRRQKEQELEHMHQGLLRLAAGMPLEQFIEAAAACEADQLEPRIAQLNEELEAEQQRQKEFVETITRERVTLEGMDGSDEAAAADEQAQALLARIRDDAEQYGRLRLAAAILRQAIERYRENNQDPLLQRASRLFSELTLGSFSSLREDYDKKGTPILVGVRGDGRAVVTLDGMSEGCCDQLYLALRLASLEHYLSRNPPLPFVVDDVLVQFDDQRSAAALRVLSELSRRTQVLFFTHHEHLVSLAQEHTVDGTLFVHRLGA